METKELIINDKEIIDLWRKGYTIKTISKIYLKSKKDTTNKMKTIDAQKIVESLIFDYQTNLMKGVN